MCNILHVNLSLPFVKLSFIHFKPNNIEQYSNNPKYMQSFFERMWPTEERYNMLELYKTIGIQNVINKENIFDHRNVNIISYGIILTTQFEEF